MSLDPERWQQVKALLGSALELAPEARRPYLDGQCDDPELRREADSYLAAYDSESLRIEVPAGEGDFAAGDGSDPLDLGETIGPYRLLRRLGAGGMGEVFLAEQEGAIRRTVALKLIRAGSSGFEVAARFVAERRTLALMSHPNIARVFDAGESRSGRPYVAMEYIEGATLTRYCDAHKLGLRERLKLFVAACRGVQHAHQKGVIHRDLKPGNVLVATEDGQPVPKIIDFGVAKAVALGAEEAPLLTAQGQWIGTPDYMSPEQAGGSEGAVDTRSDVYSLGVVLYELLTGVLPFEPQALRQGGLAALLATLREQEPPPISARLRALGARAAEVARSRGLTVARLEALLEGDLESIVRKAMEKEPERRYASAAELAEDVSRHLRHEPVLAAAPGTGVYLRKLVRRHRLGFIATGLVLLSLILGIVGTGWSLVRALRAEREAREQARRAQEEAAKAEAVIGFVLEMFRSADPGRSLSPDSTLREVLDQSEAQIRSLSGQPLVQARAMNFMGRTYRALGRFAMAKSLLLQSLRIRRRFLGASDLAIADGSHDLGRVYLDLADYPRARQLFKSALAIEAKQLDLADPRLASTLNLLGTALKQSGEPEKARKSFERALAIYERQPKVNPVEVAMVLDNLGLLFVEMGENARAQALLERALGLHEQALGASHPALAYSLNNLAMAAANLGDSKKARALLSRAVEIDRATYGPGHPNVGIGLFNLAELAGGEGDCRTAVALYRQSEVIFRRHYAANHPSVLEVHRRLVAARACSAVSSK